MTAQSLAAVYLAQYLAAVYLESVAAVHLEHHDPAAPAVLATIMALSRTLPDELSNSVGAFSSPYTA